MVDEERIAELIHKKLRSRLTMAEKEELEAWTQASDVNRKFMANDMEPDNILSEMKIVLQQNDKAIVRKLNFLCPEISLEMPLVIHLAGWYVGRAAVLILTAGLITGGILFFRHKQVQSVIAKAPPVREALQEEDRPRMTLQNGTTIFLDKVPLGGGFDADGWRISRIDSESFVYSKTSLSANKEAYHILTTYGQSLHIFLPDRSEIQLSTATSIRYAVINADAAKGKREVQLDGEAYFAVAKNRRLPFEVSTHKARITVLSTIFDVRDYKNSSEFQAAVVKGSINVSDGKKTVKLRAGEAARIDTFSAGLHKIDKYDTARGLAWRSNFFDFTDLNVRQSMQALAGWYGKDSIVILSGVDTVSPGLISAGLIRKGWDLNKLLPNLGKRHHIHLHSEGKRIIAKPL